MTCRARRAFTSMAENGADLLRQISRQTSNAELLVTAVAQGEIFDRGRAIRTVALVNASRRPVQLVGDVPRSGVSRQPG